MLLKKEERKTVALKAGRSVYRHSATGVHNIEDTGGHARAISFTHFAAAIIHSEGIAGGGREQEGAVDSEGF